MTYLKNLYLRLTYDFWRPTLPKYGISAKGVTVLECGIGPGYLFGSVEGWFPQASFLGLEADPNAPYQVNGFEILRDGTTGFSGIPVFRKLPLALFNWVPLFAFGFFPWNYGEVYICISQKEIDPLPGVSLGQRL